jgi:hypothetical protein
MKNTSGLPKGKIVQTPQFAPLVRSHSGTEAPLRNEPGFLKARVNKALIGIAEAVNSSTDTGIGARNYVKTTFVHPPQFPPGQQYTQHPLAGLSESVRPVRSNAQYEPKDFGRNPPPIYTKGQRLALARHASGRTTPRTLIQRLNPLAAAPEPKFGPFTNIMKRYVVPDKRTHISNSTGGSRRRKQTKRCVTRKRK